MSDSIFLTNGNGEITGLVDTSYAGELIIPKYVAGEAITTIGNSAFADCVNITSVTIPENITRIGKQCFEGCSKLEHANIYCSNPTVNKSGAFGGCPSLKTAYIDCEVIGYNFFGGCNTLSSVSISNRVTSIEDAAFWSCSALSFIYIPDRIAGIGTSVFDGCTSLTTIYVDDPNNLSAAVSSYNWSAVGSNGVTFVSADELYRVSKLVINKMTLDQYKTAKSEGLVADEVYVITDLDEAIDAKIEAAFAGIAVAEEVKF